MNKKQLEEKMLEKNVLMIVGEITEQLLHYVQESIAELIMRGSPNIVVFICSSGGSVEAGLDIYDMLKLYPGKKTGLVAGDASSMAAIVLQACDCRTATRHSRILIHHINRRRINLDQLRSESKIQAIRLDLEESQAYLYSILVERTKKTLGEIKRECKKDNPMPIKKAIEFGLIDEVWKLPFPIARAEK